MAKTSSIEKNELRKRLVAKHATERAALKATLANPATTDKEFFEAQRKLAKLPRNSAAVRIRRRCSLTGRARGFIGRFGISRLTFRELALNGKIPGVTKSSW